MVEIIELVIIIENYTIGSEERSAWWAKASSLVETYHSSSEVVWKC